MLHTVIIVTSVVPPELPMELSLAVTNSLKSLISKAIYCTEPFRVPLGGKVDTCCFDKTGTLTSDEMVLKGVIVKKPKDDVKKPDTMAINTLTSLLEPTDATIPEVTNVVLASCHSLALQSDLTLIGDPLEKAVLSASGWSLSADNKVVHRDGEKDPITILRRFAFDSKLKRMSCVVSDHSLSLSLVAKGAPEQLKGFFDPETVPMHYDTVSTYHMAKGRRVLALGHKQLAPDVTVAKLKSLPRQDLEKDMMFAGFIVLTCPIKTDTASVISDLKNSGHTCVMITGDAVMTAAEVARKVGIVEAQPEKTLELRAGEKGEMKWCAMETKICSEEDGEENTIKHEEGRDFLRGLVESGYELCLGGDALTALVGPSSVLLSKPVLSVLKSIVPHVTVFARHAPKQKEAVIAALNEAGMYTMMCGDGTNDVGALKQAHVGISLISVPELESKTRSARSDIEILKKLQKTEKKLEKARASNNDNKVMELEKQVNKLKRKRAKRGGTGGLGSQMKKLREAEAELNSVSLGDASVASPFTYRGTSISCCKQIALQGRCTLVTMLQIYKILGVNCLVTAVTLSRLTINGVKQGDTQLTAVGLVVAALFFFVSVSKVSVSKPGSDSSSTDSSIPNVSLRSS